MGELVDPRVASINSLIDWLREKRRRDPVSRLSDFLSGHEFDERRLVDIACIDLMQRQRMGNQVSVESYLEEFPCLRTDANLLDLIDAELCVAIELGTDVDVDDYIQRFPALEDKVRELVELEVGAESGMTSALIEVNDLAVSIDDTPVGAERSSHSQSKDFSIEVLPRDATPTRIASLTQHPVDVPEWFVGDQCVASGPGRWLIRGRDSVRGIALALKVTELPAQLTEIQSQQILDACEVAAKVRHPSWVLPSVAAIQQRHLGVIRPWLFARPWGHSATTQDQRTQLRNLATVAFAVESAHQVGATHGGIHVENLLIDHEAKVQVMDAGSSRIGLDRWLNPARRHVDAQQIASLDERINVDTQDLIKLVAAASVEWEQAWARDLVADLRRIAAKNPGEACGMIGQSLVRCADLDVSDSIVRSNAGEQRRSWLQRLTQWFDKAGG